MLGKNSSCRHFLCRCLGQTHLDISAATDLDAVSAVSDHVVLHYLPTAGETDSVAPVFVDAVTSELHPAVLLHRDAASAVVEYAVCGHSRQLTALQHGHAGAAVAVYKVGENVQRLAALHVQTNRYGERWSIMDYSG